MKNVAVATEPFIHLANVTKSYGKGAKTHLAISNATFDVMPGELVSLVGPSGCGKSTLLKILAGLHPHDGWYRDHGLGRGAVRSGPRHRHGVPAAAAVEVADGHRQRPAAGRDPRPAGEGEPGPARATCSRWSASPAPRTSAPTSSRAACSSGRRSPAR
jgi:energy-coupling factor transporter ATP-binding protein EcfA2